MLKSLGQLQMHKLLTALGVLFLGITAYGQIIFDGKHLADLKSAPKGLIVKSVRSRLSTSKDRQEFCRVRLNTTASTSKLTYLPSSSGQIWTAIFAWSPDDDPSLARDIALQTTRAYCYCSLAMARISYREATLDGKEKSSAITPFSPLSIGAERAYKFTFEYAGWIRVKNAKAIENKLVEIREVCRSAASRVDSTGKLRKADYESVMKRLKKELLLLVSLAKA